MKFENFTLIHGFRLDNKLIRLDALLVLLNILQDAVEDCILTSGIFVKKLCAVHFL